MSRYSDCHVIHLRWRRACALPTPAKSGTPPANNGENLKGVGSLLPNLSVVITRRRTTDGELISC
ncbi:MAG: hypothetical protein IIW87_05340 [Alistipes sp.]|nr:hypothetical protein [Alistipes sp.]